MPFCSNCGAKLEDDAKFCPNCGAKVGGAEGQAEPSKPNTTKARFIVSSGLQLSTLKFLEDGTKKEIHRMKGIAGMYDIEIGKPVRLFVSAWGMRDSQTVEVVPGKKYQISWSKGILKSQLTLMEVDTVTNFDGHNI